MGPECNSSLRAVCAGATQRTSAPRAQPLTRISATSLKVSWSSDSCKRWGRRVQGASPNLSPTAERQCCGDRTAQGNLPRAVLHIMQNIAMTQERG